ncbi:ACP S-malonyltransferase [Planktothrix paucivesiculata]|uniref:Malonyl CoA-acyl carrier protein transacylase n=1 Tax=Planktothrix paucivesiculata PCC 9631 TaxID=671071 RepID=A0A7Z9BI31_9CYAN|nr:ACP S-malonyltransferase [Planktothrix paucivesiculata]VXD11540.1 Malonyl CoA-acyl carrier protein transacylase [Planktothrix paucivesiculata PCC 9631]
MTTTAWIFPGQGSQKIGMGADLFEQSEHQERLKLAEKILGWCVPEICQDPEDKISQTLYTQPSLYVLETLLVDKLKQQGQSPDYVAGHSLGEYVALYAAGVFDFGTGLKLVQCRAELMNTAAGGQMAALIGFDREQLDQQIQQTPNIVLANDNSAAQVVISGTPEAVDQVLANIKVKRAVKLNVSGAFHSPLMQEAATEFQQILDGISFNTAQIPVLSNVDPTPTTDGTLLKQRLTQQMTGSVRWREICLQLSILGVTQVVEIGPGNVLTGLMKRTCPEILLKNI